jgi:hypothetical protein
VIVGKKKGGRTGGGDAPPPAASVAKSTSNRQRTGPENYRALDSAEDAGPGLFGRLFFTLRVWLLL